MKLSEYLKDHIPTANTGGYLLRRTRPVNFVEIYPKEFDSIMKQLDILELGLEPMNPLERLGIDMLLEALYIDTNDKPAVAKLMAFLKTH